MVGKGVDERVKREKIKEHPFLREYQNDRDKEENYL